MRMRDEKGIDDKIIAVSVHGSGLRRLHAPRAAAGAHAARDPPLLPGLQDAREQAGDGRGLHGPGRRREDPRGGARHVPQAAPRRDSIAGSNAQRSPRAAALRHHRHAALASPLRSTAIRSGLRGALRGRRQRVRDRLSRRRSSSRASSRGSFIRSLLGAGRRLHGRRGAAARRSGWSASSCSCCVACVADLSGAGAGRPVQTFRPAPARRSAAWLFGSGLRIGVMLLVSYSILRITSPVIARFERTDRVDGGPECARAATPRAHARDPDPQHLVTLVSCIALLMILRELNLDITPILTGAGIVGLAIGFGAQTLVKDVISGFFLHPREPGAGRRRRRDQRHRAARSRRSACARSCCATERHGPHVPERLHHHARRTRRRTSRSTSSTWPWPTTRIPTG